MQPGQSLPPCSLYGLLVTACSLSNALQFVTHMRGKLSQCSHAERTLAQQLFLRCPHAYCSTPSRAGSRAFCARHVKSFNQMRASCADVRLLFFHMWGFCISPTGPASPCWVARVQYAENQTSVRHVIWSLTCQAKSAWRTWAKTPSPCALSAQ